MIHNTSGKSVSSKTGLLRFFTVAVVTALSSVMLAMPAHATGSEPSVSPAQPTFERGGPSPALVFTSVNIGMPVNVKRIYIKMDSGSRDTWAVKSGCTSTPSSTLSNCAVTSVKVTDNGVMTDLTSGVQVAQTIGQIEIIFNDVLQQVLVNGVQGTRIIEVSLAQGAFTVSPTASTLNVTLQFISEPNQQGATFSSLQNKQFSNYAGVSFNGGAGSVGTMTGILSPESSLLPANTFTRSGSTFSGWACSEGGAMVHLDQSAIELLQCSTLYAVWAEVGSSAPATTSTPAAPASAAPASTTPAAKLATTGTSVSAWAPALALVLGWMLVAYSRSLRASRVRRGKN
jgi:hypothetical protein